MGTIILLILFALFISWIMKSYEKYEKSTYQNENFNNIDIDREFIENTELGLFVALSAKVAKADGRVSELEAELLGNMFDDISSEFENPKLVKDILKDIFKSEKDVTYNIEALTKALNIKIKNDQNKKYSMVAFLVHLGFIDGVMTQNEQNIIENIAYILGIDKNTLQNMFNQFSSNTNSTTNTDKMSLEKAYKILGVDSNASLKDVKKAYRKLVKKYHPDIIIAQGASKEYTQEATAKVQEINDAYELIKTKLS